MVQYGNMRNFSPTNPHCTTFAPKQWLHQKEATGMESSKLPPLIGGSIGSSMEICEISALPIPMLPHLHQRHGCIKRKLRARRVQKFIALVGADTVLTSAGPQTTPFHGG